MVLDFYSTVAHLAALEDGKCSIMIAAEDNVKGVALNPVHKPVFAVDAP